MFMLRNQDFCDYVGFHYVELQLIADICTDAVRKGETNITLDCDNLTEDDLRYLEKELEQRLSGDGADTFWK